MCVRVESAFGARILFTKFFSLFISSLLLRIRFIMRVPFKLELLSILPLFALVASQPGLEAEPGLVEALVEAETGLVEALFAGNSSSNHILDAAGAVASSNDLAAAHSVSREHYESREHLILREMSHADRRVPSHARDQPNSSRSRCCSFAVAEETTEQ